MSLPAPIAAMRAPGFYPTPPATVTLVQTHISYVFLAGEYVYKVKKPVRFSFLDFSTLERRRHFCHEEVRLNRRLAPDVYRGVVAICRDGDTYRLGAEGDPSVVEYAVHMCRLDERRILDNLLTANAVTEQMIDAVSIRMAAFHRAADHGHEVTANGDPQAISRVLADNFAGARPFRNVTISARDDDAIQAYCAAFLIREAALLRRRQSEQRIRDGHGDLRAEHVCMANPIVVFDCVEFNPQFRYCDVASEIAFLAMDLEYRGFAHLSRHLISRYALHGDDPELPRLVSFYQCYRAYVRGKVDSLKSAESEVEERDRLAAHDSARRHFALAYRHTWSDQPRLIVVFGLSGSGKSTVANALCARTGFTHLNSDVIRKQLAGLPPSARGGAELYAPEHSARTYRTMLTRAAEELRARRGVVIDATFQRRIHRDAVRAVADEHHVPLLFVECGCPETLVRERLARRVERNDGPSDADWKVYLSQRAYYEPWGNEPGTCLTLDTTAPAASLGVIIEDALRAQC